MVNQLVASVPHRYVDPPPPIGGTTPDAIIRPSYRSGQLNVRKGVGVRFTVTPCDWSASQMADDSEVQKAMVKSGPGARISMHSDTPVREVPTPAPSISLNRNSTVGTNGFNSGELGEKRTPQANTDNLPEPRLTLPPPKPSFLVQRRLPTYDCSGVVAGDESGIRRPDARV
jgi:hypothetical protein